MPKPFDATLKELIEAYPRDWLAGVGVPVREPVEVLSPELSTVTAAADSLIRVGDAVVHIDAESGPDADLPTRMLLYNVLAHRATGLPVHSIAVLLRPNANPGNLTNRVLYSVRPSGGLDFRFEVVRQWERPTGDLSEIGLGLLPLAVLGKPPKGQSRKQAVPVILEQIARRVVGTEPPASANLIVSAALILSGMYLNPDEIRQAIRRLPDMIQSSAYEVFEEMGEIKGLKRTLLRQGEAKYGKPNDDQRAKLEAIEDLPRLERLSLRLLKVNDWDALLKGR